MIRLILSDIRATYHALTVLNILKATLNPSIHACLLVRWCASTNGLPHAILRNILITKHGIDVGTQVTIGRGLRLPHPLNIVIGSTVIIGDDTTIYQGVTLGSNRGYPTIGNNVTIFPNSIIVGNITIGNSCTIGATSYIDKSTQDGSKVHGR